MLLWFVKIYESNLKKLQFTTQWIIKKVGVLPIRIVWSNVYTLHFVYSNKRSVTRYTSFIPMDYCQMLTCISLINDVTTQSRA